MPTSVFAMPASANSRYYKTADAGLIDEDGYIFVMARTDDIINCAGHDFDGRDGRSVRYASRCAECAVIGVADALKGQVPCAFVVLKNKVERDEALISREVVGLVRDEIGRWQP